MNNNPRYIVTSDIHLGHKNTATKHIISSFKSAILNKANTSITALFVAGDMFDHLLYLNTTEAQQVVQFFHYLLDYCYTNNIALKILEGTPSHDWYQSSLLVKINDVRENKANLKYFKTLDIEFCDKLNKHILYIPDEWTASQEDLDIQIRSKLLENNIGQVDISILHGSFHYQAKGTPSTAFHFDEDYFLKLTRGFIHIGHYHIHTQLDRIVAQGSLERLSHGEEGPKGYVLVDGDSFTFIENTNSFTYKSIQVKSSTQLSNLDKLIPQLPKGSFVRLVMKQDHPFVNTFKEIKLRYLDYNLKKLIKDQASVNSSTTYILSEEAIDVSSHFVLDANIYDTVMKSIEIKHDLSSKELSKLHGYAAILQTVNQTTEDTI